MRQLEWDNMEYSEPKMTPRQSRITERVKLPTQEQLQDILFQHESPKVSEPQPSESDVPAHYVDKGQYEAEMAHLERSLPKVRQRKISVPGQLIGKLDTAKKKNAKLEKRATRHLSDTEEAKHVSSSSSFSV